MNYNNSDDGFINIDDNKKNMRRTFIVLIYECDVIMKVV